MLVCMSMGTCVCVGIHARVCMWRPEVDLGCSLYRPPSYSLAHGLSP